MTQDALEHVYTLYARQVYLYARSLCGSHHVAEELTADTFYKAMLALDKESPHIKYWLLRVCRNLFVDHCRRSKREPVPLPEALSATECDPADIHWQSEERRALYLAMLRLSAHDRELLTMYYFLDCTIAQIAAHTGRTAGAVKTALCRARTRLKNMMEEERS